MFLESIGVGQTLAPYLPALSGHEQGIPLSEPQLLHLQNKSCNIGLEGSWADGDGEGI